MFLSNEEAEKAKMEAVNACKELIQIDELGILVADTVKKDIADAKIRTYLRTLLGKEFGLHPSYSDNQDLVAEACFDDLDLMELEFILEEVFEIDFDHHFSPTIQMNHNTAPKVTYSIDSITEYLISKGVEVK